MRLEGQTAADLMHSDSGGGPAVCDCSTLSLPVLAALIAASLSRSTERPAPQLTCRGRKDLIGVTHPDPVPAGVGGPRGGARDRWHLDAIVKVKAQP